ncbi:MAG: RluA family pseudouridine synthase [Polyangiaceae bacterium]|nr:RluA family pseudouridine synthase [Polyangiaceae bacterium]
MRRELVAPPEAHKQPIDRALRQLTGESWGDVRAWVTTGKVTVNGEIVADPRAWVRRGDAIVVSPSAPRPSTSARLSRDVIVHVDRHVVVVNKPAGVSTVPFDEGERGTLDELVRALLSRGPGDRRQGTLGVVQRLDKETSGLLVFARTLAAKRALAQQLREHTVHRRYLALAHGDVAAARIESHLVADRGDGLRGSTRRAGQGQRAVTHVEPVQRLRGATLVACRLETGRTHQIRVHLAERGHMLLGERVYVRELRQAPIPAPRVMLHAAELGFEHPDTGRHLRLTLAPPSDFAAVLSGLLLALLRAGARPPGPRRRARRQARRRVLRGGPRARRAEGPARAAGARARRGSVRARRGVLGRGRRHRARARRGRRRSRPEAPRDAHLAARRAARARRGRAGDRVGLVSLARGVPQRSARACDLPRDAPAVRHDLPQARGGGRVPRPRHARLGGDRRRRQRPDVGVGRGVRSPGAAATRERRARGARARAARSVLGGHALAPVTAHLRS